MTQIRLFLFFEGASLLTAALVHSGVLVEGHAHRQAATAESVIGSVLLVALGLTWLLPSRTRSIGLASQAFALLGTLVGAFTIAIGIGPRTVPDVAYHLALLGLLAWGLRFTARQPVTEHPAAGQGGELRRRPQS
jgi:cytochrome c biogenesis factor